MATVKCNMCEWQGNEDDLVLFTDEDGMGKGCPDCKTDAYLMDIE
jgi:NAD-dependent SIR2 family protein deacetylase